MPVLCRKQRQVRPNLELLKKRLPSSDPKTQRLVDNAMQAALRGASVVAVRPSEIHGGGWLVGIDAASWDGLQQRCYHLRLLSNNAQIMVPLVNEEGVGLRPLGGNGEIRSLFGILEDGNIDTYKDWKGRYKQETWTRCAPAG